MRERLVGPQIKTTRLSRVLRAGGSRTIDVWRVFRTVQFESEWIPASKSIPRLKQKVMIVLHGRGDRLESFRSLKKELSLPEFNYLLLNAPQKFLDGYSWCALEPRQGGMIETVRVRLFKLVNELKAAGWKSEQIHWLGHSQGCLVACDLVLHHPDRFGGLIGVSGYLKFFRGWRLRAAKSGARQTPWLITHGTRDRIIRPAEIRNDIKELVRGNVPVLYQEFRKGHDFDHEEEVPFIRRWIRRRWIGRRWMGPIGTSQSLIKNGSIGKGS